jgi:acetolactate synthase-1/3 small subunit
VKVRCPNGKRAEVIQLAHVFGARVADVADASVVLEIVGEEDEVDNVIRTMRGYGIMELARTGRVAMARGAAAVRAEPSQENYAEHSRLGRRPNGALPYVSD